MQNHKQPEDYYAATQADLAACIALNRQLFTVNNGEEDAIIAKRWATWLGKNPEIVYVLKKEDEVVGIATMLPFRADSEKLKRILQGDTSILLGDVDVTAEDIAEYKAGNSVQLYIAEIGVKPSLGKSMRRIYGAKLIAKFIDMVVALGKREIHIENIVAVGATRSGIRLLQRFGFTEVTFSRSDTRLFSMDMKESGAPIVRAYREALGKI